MNKQVLSTFITLLYVVPLIYFLENSLIDDKTSFIRIEGVVSKVEYIQKNQRFMGEVYVYYNNNTDKFKFYDDLLIDDTFDKRWKELLDIIQKDKKFKVIMTDTLDDILYLEVNGQKILNFNKEIDKLNHKTKIFIYIFLSIGVVIIFGNILIYYYRLNTDNWVKHPILQGMLYFIAIYAIIKFFFLS